MNLWKAATIANTAMLTASVSAFIGGWQTLLMFSLFFVCGLLVTFRR